MNVPAATRFSSPFFHQTRNLVKHIPSNNRRMSISANDDMTRVFFLNGDFLPLKKIMLIRHGPALLSPPVNNVPDVYRILQETRDIALCPQVPLLRVLSFRI